MWSSLMLEKQTVSMSGRDLGIYLILFHRDSFEGCDGKEAAPGLPAPRLPLQ